MGQLHRGALTSNSVSQMPLGLYGGVASVETGNGHHSPALQTLWDLGKPELATSSSTLRLSPSKNSRPRGCAMLTLGCTPVPFLMRVRPSFLSMSGRAVLDTYSKFNA
jgi:hypothetical protein